ncbi:MAG: carboxypeptidase regulatory-like domain-containing protein [Acidobacteria bacterium]|nr:carboxypeptidase regulatory-like domain-containing protein [Acidobacteriota bacterium]
MMLRTGLSLLFACGLLVGQEFRANISGTVTDPTGAPVAGARVEAISVERMVRYDAVSNDAGIYLIRFLPPGKYSVTVQKEGFKRAQRDGLEAQGADRLGLDIRLEVGGVTESVTVTGETPLLATETASRSVTLEQKYVDDLPTSGRNVYQLLFSQPGVIKTSRYWGSFELYAFGNINSVSINGGRSGENETLIDGVSSVRGSRSASFAPALNAIQEVAVQTNSYDASYGRFGGGVTSIVLRTGTNQFHGQLYEFLKNDNLNSNGYSANAANVARPEFKNNTFGFTVDGPVFIPKLLNGKNKLFWMLSLEALRERNPQIQLWTVPTAAERRGDYSAIVDSSRRPITIYDPLTTRANPNGAGYIRSPFAGNVLPGARINSVAAKLMDFFPAPNRVSENVDGQNNYLFVNSSKNNYNQWLGKLDYAITDRHRVSGRYGETPWYNFARVQWGTNAAEPSSEYPSTRISRNWAADWTYTISPSTVFNLRGGLARYEGFSGNTFGRNYDPRQLGFPDRLVAQFVSLQFPRFNFGGNNISPLGATQTSGYETSDSYSLQPNLQMIRGRHSMKYGAEFRRYNQNNIRPASASGNYSFSRGWTQANPQQGDALSGSFLAGFQLGYPSSGYVDRNIDPAYRNPYMSFFFQDDWKISRTVTINAGLRWDYEGPIFERYNRQIRGFAFNQPSPIASRVQGLTLNGGLLFAGSGGTDREAFNRDWNNIQPRIGIAWQVAPKWVLRGGYGLYYLGQNAVGSESGFSRRTDMITSTDGGLIPSASLSDPFPASLFPTGLLQPIGSSQGLSTNLGLAIAAQLLDRPLPKSHQFSFGFQRTLGTDWLFDASYVANITRQLPIGASLNFLSTQTLNSVPLADRQTYFNQQVTNPMAGLLPGSAFNNATVPRQQLLYAYPHFSQVGINNIAAGAQSYHSLQVKATRRFKHGLAMQGSYTWSKTLEEVALLNAQDANLSDLRASRAEKRLAEFDIPHTISVVSSYDLPFGKSRQFLSGMHPVADTILGGWSISAQYIRRGGQPIDFPNAAPLVAKSAKLTSEQRDELARKAGRSEFNPFFDKYFDTSIFPTRSQAPFTLRDFPTRFPDVRSPVLTSWEISAYKNFTLKERLKMQLRADFQNAFDQPYFGRLLSGANNVTDSRFGQLDPAQGNQPRVVVLVMKVLF